MAESFLPMPSNAADFVYIDDTSPSLLRWKDSRGNQVKRGDVAGTRRTDGRWRVNLDGKFYYTYRIYLHLKTGQDLGSNLVDHRDRNSSSHNFENLRLANRSQNNANRKPRGAYKGVSFHPQSGLWRARISIDGKEKTTYHKTAEQAAAAYDKVAITAFGDFAYLNFPEVQHVQTPGRADDFT